MQSMLCTFPNELMVLILDFLDVPTLLKCRETCTLWKSLVDDLAMLRYKVELFAAHLVDGPSSAATSAARLRTLEARSEAWRNFAWKERTSIHLSDAEYASFSAWEFRGGVLCFGAGRRLRFIQVSSPSRKIPQREWEIGDIGFDIKDICIDPSQDVLAVLELTSEENIEVFRVHFFSLLTGTPHPLSSNKCISFSAISEEDRPWWYIIQIYKGQIAVMLQSLVSDSSELRVWEWKTGAERKILVGSIHTFAFLSEELVMLAICEQDEETGYSYSSLEVADLKDNEQPPSSDAWEQTSLCSFRFPSSKTHLDISIRMEYGPSGSLQSNIDYPFATSSDDSIFVIECSQISSPEAPYLLFVPVSSFLEKVKKVVDSKLECVREWKDWGLTGTRMLQLKPAKEWFAYVHGMKALLPSPDEKSICLYDFNQREIRRSLQNKHSADIADMTTFLLGEEEVDKSSATFEEPIKTSLPYMMLSFPIPDSTKLGCEYMLGEDSVIMITADHKEIVVFSF